MTLACYASIVYINEVIPELAVSGRGVRNPRALIAAPPGASRAQTAGELLIRNKYDGKRQAHRDHHGG